MGKLTHLIFFALKFLNYYTLLHRYIICTLLKHFVVFECLTETIFKLVRKETRRHIENYLKEVRES